MGIATGLEALHIQRLMRQGDGSPIVEAAHAINAGQFPAAGSTVSGELNTNPPQASPIDPLGVITTIAGTGEAGSAGDSGAGYRGATEVSVSRIHRASRSKSPPALSRGFSDAGRSFSDSSTLWGDQVPTVNGPLTANQPFIGLGLVIQGLYFGGAI